jgi:hypothetical protein
MFRLSGLLCLSLAIFCGGALFWTSQSVQRAENRLSKILQGNFGEQEALRVLSAEWDYLNRPERLEQLTQGSLDMDKSWVDGTDFIGVKEGIPQPIIPVLPKTKPRFLQHVSTQGREVVEFSDAEPLVIKKIERNNFSKLIDSVAGSPQLSGGQP